MFEVSGGAQVANGRSLDADKIYQQYLDFYTAINEKIHAIDCLPYEQRNLPNVQKDRAELNALRDQLHPIYSSDWSNSTATLASFQKNCASIIAKVDAAFNDAMGEGSSVHDQIEKAYIDAQNAAASLEVQIGKDQNKIQELLNQLATLKATIANLQEQAQSNPKALEDLNTANIALAKLNSDIATADAALSTLQGMFNAISGQGGILEQLQQLESKQNPTQGDLDQAQGLWSNVQAALTYEQATFQANLASANASLQAVNAAVQTVQKDLIPDPTIHEQIQNAYTTAQNTLNTLLAQIAADQTSLNNLLNQAASLQAAIAALQQQIADLPDSDSRKSKAQSDLTKANQTLTTVNSDISTAQTQMTALQGLAHALTAKGGTSDQLTALAAKQNPTQTDLDAARNLANKFQAAQNFETSVMKGALTTAIQSLQIANTAIQAVQNDLKPAPTPGKIEHGTWYIDWTSWDFAVPKGVNTVNIFVGNMHLDGNGKAIFDGFGNMDHTKMAAFVQACEAQGIAVKISLGGGGGSYDHLWSNLTEANYAACAQSLIDFCRANNIKGVDFDIEEFNSPQDRPEQQALCGKFIKAFKDLDPSMQTSICTNAGFGPYFPWPGITKNILDAATAGGVCAVDKVYIMSYYDPIQNEKNWILGWANWLKETYNFSNSQIVVGLDDFDAHAYDIKEFAAWAAQNGFSTCYWAWNPATPEQSDKSSQDIADSYERNIPKKAAQTESLSLLHFQAV